MSRSYQGRHRALPVSPLHSARVALPALAAASLTVAAAGTAVATDTVPEAKASGHLATGAADTTQWTRTAGSNVASRSLSSTAGAASQTRTSAATAAKVRADAANRSRLAKDVAARRAAIGAIGSTDTSMKSYTVTPKAAPAPAPEPKRALAVTASRGTSAPTPAAAPATTSRSSASSTQSTSSSSGWVRPVSGGSFTSGYGYRWGRMHSGVDFAVSSGTPLRAMNDGTVIATGWYGGQGKRVVVRFANGTEAHYAHMSSIGVSVGERVSAGERIGYSGNTGNSTGPHLHLEIHVGGSPINPYPWLESRGLV